MQNNCSIFFKYIGVDKTSKEVVASQVKMFSYYYDVKTRTSNLEQVLRTEVEKDIMITAQRCAEYNESLRVYISSPEEYFAVVYDDNSQEVSIKDCDESQRVYKSLTEE